MLLVELLAFFCFLTKVLGEVSDIGYFSLKFLDLIFSYLGVKFGRIEQVIMSFSQFSKFMLKFSYFIFMKVGIS